MNFEDAKLFCCPSCGEGGKIERSWGGLWCAKCTFHVDNPSAWNQEAFWYLVQELGSLKKEMKEKESWGMK